MTPDALIIGGGVIGLSCAAQLATEGLAVSVAATPSIPAASSVAMGVLWPPSPTKNTSFQRLHRESLRIFPDYVNQLTDADIYSRCGGLEILSSEHQLEMAKREEEAAAEFQVVTKAETEELEKSCRALEYGGLYVESTGRVLVTELLNALQQRCNELEVQLIDRELSAVDEVPAGNVVVCAGLHSPGLSPELKKYAPLKPVKGQVLLVESNIELSHIIRWQRNYITPLGSGLVLIGATTEKNEAAETLEVTTEAKQTLLTTAATAVPELANAKVLNHVAGVRSMSVDRKPYIGRVPESANLFVATGHYKIGIGFAPITAKIISDLIVRGDTEYELDRVQPGFARLQ